MKKIGSLFLTLCISISLLGCTSKQDTTTDYSNIENWAYCENESSNKVADVFFICPSIQFSQDGMNMSLDDQTAKENAVAAINMEKGIYDGDARFFAPFYQEAGLACYELDEQEREQYLEYAYQDIKASFQYYLDNYNEDRPIILAGFSQGADMCIRLMKDFMSNEDLLDQVVACYAIGWRLTKEDVETYTYLQPAQSESDVHTIICYNSQSADVAGTVLLPEGEWTYSINPLNWKTDGTVASKDENAGACFTNSKGEISSEIPQLTGAYIDQTTGALIASDIDPSEYSPVLDFLPEGCYHIYDYMFFYRNLQGNVSTRLSAWERGH